jgi:hypothetical protein
MLAKANDATLMFENGWLTIKHTGLGAIARGRKSIRIHVKGMVAVELRKPGLTAGWFTVVSESRALGGPPVEPHRDPLTVRFSDRALSDLEAIRSAIHDAMVAIRPPQPDAVAQ